MHRPIFHRLISVLCLVAFGFQTVGAIGLVRCTDASGESRLEWGCPREVSGTCAQSDDAAASTDGDHHSDQLPCEDTPIQDELGTAATRVTMRADRIDLPPPTVVVIPVSLEPSSHRFVCARTDARIAIPPPEIARIRTVVMLV